MFQNKEKAGEFDALLENPMPMVDLRLWAGAKTSWYWNRQKTIILHVVVSLHDKTLGPIFIGPCMTQLQNVPGSQLKS